jgi:hypothetical protein
LDQFESVAATTAVTRGHSPSKTGVNAPMTRGSIHFGWSPFRTEHFAKKKMDCRVKPGNASELD